MLLRRALRFMAGLPTQVLVDADIAPEGLPATVLTSNATPFGEKPFKGTSLMRCTSEALRER